MCLSQLCHYFGLIFMKKYYNVQIHQQLIEIDFYYQTTLATHVLCLRTVPLFIEADFILDSNIFRSNRFVSVLNVWQGRLKRIELSSELSQAKQLSVQGRTEQTRTRTIQDIMNENVAYYVTAKIDFSLSFQFQSSHPFIHLLLC
ncbi:Hypothetical_protein [Hexamita inflata]|uniref:Hypothetical_protein n=1 Tax=Hexamita inflata TaxID=28002 RepID=A0AA86TL68_9EUKA|nr:Hypothetical protein HINF_LOCUS8221 [Hexamita inflata]